MKAIFCVLMAIYFSYFAISYKGCTESTRGIAIAVSFVNIVGGLLFFILGK